MEEVMPSVYKQLHKILKKLERHARRWVYSWKSKTMDASN
jgi:hypothetical protein